MLTAAGKRHHLHYVFDLWAHRWRRRCATGNVVMVRYADDIVIGFDKRYDARRFRIAMQRRLREFGLTVHPEKTRLMEFGRFAAENRAIGERQTRNVQLPRVHAHRREDRNGRFMLIRKTRRDRMTATLKAIKDGLRRRWHYSIPNRENGSESGSGIPELSLGTERLPHHAEVQDTRNKPLAPGAQAQEPEDDTTWTKANKLAAA
ncbi:reverse transcriptase domain-containing protein [Klebsiella pneumoniae]